MSAEGVSLESLERTKRSVMRSIKSTKAAIDAAFTENPSEDVAHKIGSLLETQKLNLTKLEDISNEILEITDVSGKTPAQIAEIEGKITKDFEQGQLAYSVLKGKLNAMFARLNKFNEPKTRRSMDTSIVGEGSSSNPLVKLPDIPVPKFDGKIANFTEWYSMFVAIIDANESLKPVQKLYFLKQAMTGDAQNLLKDYKLQEDLYESAFKFVKDRFYNNRIIIGTHFRDLLDLPQITLANLRESLDKLNAIVRGLRVCDIDVEKMSPLIVYIIVRKLPEKLRTDWENSLHDYSTYPSFEPLSSFLQNRCFAHESVHGDLPSKSSPRKSNAEEKLKQKASLATIAKVKVATTSPKCSLCNKDHYLSQCAQFQAKTVADRFAFIKEKQLCSNCFRQYHSAINCNSSKCRKCGKAHHTLLHREVAQSTLETKTREGAQSTSDTKPKDESTLATRTSLTVVANKTCIVLLPSAVVNVQVGSKIIKARVLLDSCSQVNLVSESFVKKHKIVSRSTLSTIACITPGDLNACAAVSLSLKSRFGNFKLDIDADVVGRIPYEVSPNTIKMLENVKLNFELADCSLPSSNVDILIGAKHTSKILLGNKSFVGDLCFEESCFGWVAEGPLERFPRVDKLCCHLTTHVEDSLVKFWEIEEIDPPKRSHSDHELCEAHFNSTYTRLKNGQFQVRLPLKKSTRSLADTYAQARNALLRSETKFNDCVRSLYIQFMIEYRELRHMEVIEDSISPRYFIPHLPVLRPDSSTTKLRVVFNAAAKNLTGISLNEILLNGPILQPELFDTLLHFRTYVIAFSADVNKMYRRIVVHPDDRYLQTILWRDNPSYPIQKYQLTTLTYGTTPAAYIATKCLQVLAKNIESKQPEVAQAIASEFYMDDLLTGANSVKAAISKQKQIQATLDSAHLPLRKYVSNSKEFLDSLDTNLIEELCPLAFSSSGTAKILGLQWHPADDYFIMNVKAVNIEKTVLTKRVVSSLIAQIFDPLGFVAPVTIRAKLLLQDLWREGRQWDDPVSCTIAEKFRDYHGDLQNLALLHIPRKYFCSSISSFDIVGFCDASNSAYGAVVYLRVYNQSKINSVLVCAKTRVAPLKQLTIPRLELLGAVLLAKLLARVCKILKYDICKASVFCDSTIVLAWLKGPSSKYQAFVRNRVDFVTNTLPYCQWHYVKTTENPADLLTRGVSVNALVNNSFWLGGPSWLTHNSLEFTTDISLPSDVPEARNIIVCHTLVFESPFDESLISHYSSFDKLTRIVSLICKFIFRLRPSLDRFDQLDDFFRSLYVICHISQNVYFSSEIVSLKNRQLLPKKSTLLALDPFLDTYGILRVGGRLRNAHLPYDNKHPIILSRRSTLANLLVRHLHEKYFHATRSFTLARIQSRYWIHGGATRLVKKVISQCVWCTRMKAETLSQIMGDLPRERITISRPFAYSGVDFAGPFLVKCTNHRVMKHLKYYAAFFVCLTTRAIHIESVADLSTEAFIASLQRFSARRGIPNTLWSDNATNFVGAKNVLERFCQSINLKWKFIPPRSPHHGGIWESAVKAGKKHLIAVTRNSLFDAEQLTTLLTQIEAILNSRPLYRKQDVANPEIIDVLTPGHFLVGSSLLDAAPPELSSITLTERLDCQKQIIRCFWLTWKTSYLAQLQARSKWKTASSCLQVGDIVLLKEDTVPLHWPLGRVTQVLPDAESRTRVVVVSSNGSLFKRSIQQLVKLPIETS